MWRASTSLSSCCCCCSSFTNRKIDLKEALKGEFSVSLDYLVSKMRLFGLLRIFGLSNETIWSLRRLFCLSDETFWSQIRQETILSLNETIWSLMRLFGLLWDYLISKWDYFISYDTISLNHILFEIIILRIPARAIYWIYSIFFSYYFSIWTWCGVEITPTWAPICWNSNF